MANVKKKHKKSAAKFRRTEPYLYSVCSAMISNMSEYIKRTGAPEVGAYIDYNGKIICYENN